MWPLITALIIQSSAPPLTPAEAAAIVARLPPPTNMTHVVFAPPEYPRPPVVIIKQTPPPTNVAPWRPLNCCDRYVIRIPHREGRK